MTIKSILVPLDGTDAGPATLETGFMAGAMFKAHVNVLHIRPDSLAAAPAAGEAMSGDTVENFPRHLQVYLKRAQGARRIFEAACTRHNVRVIEGGAPTEELTASFLDRVGRRHDVICRLGRVNDLIVIGHPSRPDDDHVNSLTFDALFQTGRPVLVAPRETLKSMGRIIAIAWNGSAQCARAIGDATNFFSQAQKIVVLTAESEHTPKTLVPELVSYLQCHGAPVETRIIGNMGDIHLGGRQLLAAAETEGADLLVMGAKVKRNEIKKMVMGCSTGDVLNMARIPLLMGH